MTYLTPKEAAAKLKLSLPTLRKYVRAGKIPAVRMGRTFRVIET